MVAKKTIFTGAGIAAVLTAIGGVITAVHGSHSTTTAIQRNSTPLVVNRPRDAKGSPLPVTVEKLPDGTPLVIVGHGAPAPCPSPSPSPTSLKMPKPSPTASPADDC